MPLHLGPRFGVYSSAIVYWVALAAGLGCTPEPPDRVTCSQTVQDLAAAALAHVAEARDLPDFNLLADDQPILVSNRIGGLSCALPDTVLPASSELPMRLANREQLQSLANADGQAQYVDMSDARGLERPEASIRIGVGMLLAEDDHRGLLCCCSGEATFRHVEGAWVFVRWTSSVCS